MTGMLSSLAVLALVAVPEHAAFEPDDAPLGGLANRLLHAKVSGSPHWSDRKPEFAVDGSHANPGDHWAAEHIPVSLTVELAEPQELNVLQLWTYWGDGRYYQYVLEGSADGQTWTVLGDRRDNTAPGTAAGERFVFPTTRLKYVRTTFTKNSVGNGAGGHIVELEGYLAPPERLARLQAGAETWGKVPAGLQGAVGSLNTHYARDAAPALTGTDWRATAWRGERVHAQLVVWSRDGATQLRLLTGDLTGEAGTIPASRVSARFVRYVLADGQLVGDVLDPVARLDLPPRSTRPIWLAVDVPADTKPGVYQGSFRVAAAGGAAVEFPVRLEVLGATLPPPDKWSFRLDLWQNPYAIARYHHVEPWSPEHLGLLEPHLRLLASAGQKCITTTLIHQPWGTQTYDPYDGMVTWLRRADGSWRYDYTAFDRYVELALRCGLTDSISCYSMAPWTNRYQYLDEASGELRAVVGAPGSKAYEEHWRPFLADFTRHLRERGWLAKTAIAMDERPLEVMKPLIAFVHDAAPDLKLALAGSHELALKDTVDDWCVFIAPPLEAAVARERAGRGKPTTFYVCCGPARPNTFVASPPAEATWLGWYAAARDYTGFLRWAYDSWVEDPLHDTTFVRWPAGDCFLVYPGGRSSIRFERLREGIQDYEKVRLVRAALTRRGDVARLKTLNDALAAFGYEAVQKTPAEAAVDPAKAVLVELARGLGNGEQP